MEWLQFIGITRDPRIQFWGGKTIVERKPITPYWTRPAGGQRRGVTLDGADFLRQNYSAYSDGDTPPSSDLDIVCGSKTYRNLVEAYTFQGPDCDPGLGPDATIARAYDFTIQSSPISTVVSFPGQPYYDYPRSATIWNLNYGSGGASINSGCFLYTVDGELTNEVTKTWLEGQITSWQGLTGAQKDSLYTTVQGFMSYATEAEEGWKLQIAFHEYRPYGHWFSETDFGMTGDSGTYWNGNFSTHIIKQTRKNYPSLWLEATKSGSIIFGPTNGKTSFPTTGENIYKAGYYEAELSDEVTGQWVDSWGVFRFDGDGPLAGCPLLPDLIDGFTFTGYCRGADEGEANEWTLLSATGRRYRVEIQIGGGYPWTTDETVTLETHQATLRAVHSFGPSAYLKKLRVAKVEEWSGEEWKNLGDIAAWDEWSVIDAAFRDAYDAWYDTWLEWFNGGEEGPEPEEPDYTAGPAPSTPGELIGTSPLDGRPLVSVGKYRNGSAFGFSPLNFSSSGRRWATRTYRKHRTVGTFDTAGKTGCGSSSISGTFDLEYVQRYIDGELQDLESSELLEWNAEIDGVVWTPDDWTPFISLPSTGASIQTETLRRFDLTGGYDQYASVSFDRPDSNGMLIAEDTENVAMSIDGNANKGPWIDIDVPASGQAVLVLGHRLTYTP